MSEHIVSLQISNVKRITAVQMKLDPESRTVVISGENGAGKSSVLDSIEMALAGRSSVPSKPIREGKQTARIILETETMIVTRTFSAPDNTSIKIENKAGYKASSPQKMLDDMIALIGFDPLSFAQMSSEDQGRELLKVFPTKIDLKQNGNFQKGTYDERTDVNRQLKALHAVIRSSPSPENVATVEVSVSALSQRSVELREELNKLHGLKRLLESAAVGVMQCDTEIANLKKTIENWEAAKVKRQAEFDKLKNTEVREEEKINAEIDSIDKQIQNAETVNSQIRAQRALQEKITAAEALEKKTEELTSKLEQLEKARADALMEAKFPVEGLSIDKDGIVILNGVPFKQASMAQKLIVGIAIAAAAPSKLRVCLIRDASLLDAKSMATVHQMAKEKDIQIWMERVEDGSPMAVQIVEGSNIGATDAPEIETTEKPAAAAKDAPPAGDFTLGTAAPAKKSRKKESPADNTNPFKA